jgi:hypothetical protein
MIGLIVDGEGDHAAFRARYGRQIRVLKTDGPRGHTTSDRTLIDAAKKQIAMLVGWGCKRIAIVTDFEGRSGSAFDFCKRVRELAGLSQNVEDLLVFAPDMMFENWLLADIAHVCSQKKYLKKLKCQKTYESLNGKSELKKLFIQGYDYNEVRHSAELFPLVRGEEAAKRSPSFALFRSELGLD